MVKSIFEFIKYICTVCGQIIESDTMPEVCPVCGAKTFRVMDEKKGLCR